MLKKGFIWIIFRDDAVWHSANTDECEADVWQFIAIANFRFLILAGLLQVQHV